MTVFEGVLTLETNDNVKLSTEAYKDLIEKYFIQTKERPSSIQKHSNENPQRFGDLRR